MNGPVALVNRALAALGAPAIASLDDPSEEARRAAVALPEILAELADVADWPETIQRAELVRLADPDQTWAQFMLPVDCLHLRSVDGVAFAPAQAADKTSDPPWRRVEGRRLFCPPHQTRCVVDYVAYVTDPDQLPPLARKAAVQRIAAELAYAMSGDVRVNAHFASAADKSLSEARRTARRRPRLEVIDPPSAWVTSRTNWGRR